MTESKFKVGDEVAYIVYNHIGAKTLLRMVCKRVITRVSTRNVWITPTDVPDTVIKFDASGVITDRTYTSCIEPWEPKHAQMQKVQHMRVKLRKWQPAEIEDEDMLTKVYALYMEITGTTKKG